MNEVNYGKCRNLSVIWEFRKYNSFASSLKEMEALRNEGPITIK